MPSSVLHIVVTSNFAGTERYVADVATETAARGVRVTVVGGDPARMPQELGPDVRWLPGATIPQALISVLRTGRHDVCHTHLTYAEAVGAVTQPLHRGLLLATRHFAAHRGSSRLGRLLAPWLNRALDRQVAISQFVNDALEDPADAVVLNGTRARLLLWRPGSRRVLVLQRLEAEKNTDTAIDAWRVSGLAAKGWSLRIVGQGSQEAALRARAAGLSDVEFAGYTDDVAGEFAHAGVLLATANAEPLGLSVIEAMAAGVPVVAAAAGGHLETIGSIGETTLYPPGNPRSAAQRLVQLAEDGDFRQSMSERSVTRHREAHTLTGHVDSLLRNYVVAMKSTKPRRLKQSPSLTQFVTVIAAIASFATAMAYAFLTPRFLPYDEPSHWHNVQYIVANWSLPVVGHGGVTYEGQQGPLAYLVDAVIYKASLVFLHPDGAFLLVRATGLVWLTACAAITYRIACRASDWQRRGPVVAGVMIAYFNPMLMACAMSVQNDIPALALSLLALDLVLGRPLQAMHPFLAGVFAGLAMLTKITVLPVAITIVLWLIWRRAYRSALVTALTITTCTSWWIIRNQVLYGDPSGAGAVARLGLRFEPIGWHGSSTIVDLARAVVTTLWLPVEYYRNTINAPGAVGIMVSLVTVLALVIGIPRLLRNSVNEQTACICLMAALSLAMWVHTDVFVEGLSFRIAYLTLPCWVILLASAIDSRYRFQAISLSFALLTILHLWTLAAVAHAFM